MEIVNKILEWCHTKNIEHGIVEQSDNVCSILVLLTTHEYMKLTQLFVDNGININIRLCTRHQKRIILHGYENIKIRVVIKGE